MAPRQGPRLHRLPHRLDYTLIPAPLNLSLPLVSEMSEKSPLPAIIVTPSSPSTTHNFSIAFLAPPAKPSLKERVASLYPSIPVKGRTMLLVFLILFVLICHIVTHQLAGRRPHLEFSTQGQAHMAESVFGNWFNFRSVQAEDKPDFVIFEGDTFSG
ncbi:hypothetical protein BDN72DRAFT_893084 [Pluteus cervinus]|uniref:Uncharacterized protein n=1 Tax=Pluteus cervinus TaxID=181527 RepID=A0ACD3B9R5_9AGAR|nr:hypothetical protein BDN72DRAFT_893084 [Pluteus cervinus]